MRKITVLLTITFWLIISAPASAIDGYDYYIKIDAHNTGTAAKTVRIAPLIDGDALIDGGYLQEDGDDIVLSSGGTEKPLCAVNLNNGTPSYWYFDYITLPAGGYASNYIWVGNHDASGRDQYWIGSVNDSNSIGDSASMRIDQVDDPVIEVMNISTIITPGSPEYILHKSYSYSLYADGTPSYNFAIWEDNVGPGVTQFLPTGAGSSNSLTAVPAGSNWLRVTSDDTTTSYVYAIAANQTDYYVVDISSIPEGSKIHSVKACIKGAQIAGVGGVVLSTGIKTAEGTTVGPDHILGAGWTLWQDVMARPGGGAWTYDGLSGAQIRVNSQNIVGSTGVCTYAYLLIDYDSPGTKHQVTIPLVVGTKTSFLTASYISGDLLITDGINTGTENGINADLFQVIDAVDVLESNIKLSNITLTSSGTYVLNLDFEVENISSGTITDISSYGNDVTYSLEAMDPEINLTVNALTPSDVEAYLGYGSGTDSGVWAPVYFPDESDNFFPDDSSGTPTGYSKMPGASAINPSLDTLEIPRSAFWLCFFAAIIIAASYFIFDKQKDVVGVAIMIAIIVSAQLVWQMGVGLLDGLILSLFYIALYYRREIGTGRL